MIYVKSVVKNITYVQVAADEDTLLEPLGIIGYGEARCRPQDVFSSSTGVTIAMGRAIQDYGRRVEDAGHAAIVTREELARVGTLTMPEAAAGLS